MPEQKAMTRPQATERPSAAAASPQSDVPAPEPQNGQRPPPPGVQLVPPGTPDAEEPLATEEEEILHEGGQGDQMDPQVLMRSANARIQGSSLPVPTKLLRMLPILRAAANDPKQPASVRAIYRTTVLSIEQRLKNGR